jgi:hypothetical protein
MLAERELNISARLIQLPMSNFTTHTTIGKAANADERHNHGPPEDVKQWIAAKVRTEISNQPCNRR